MANPVYEYNPYNTNIDNTVTEAFTITPERNAYYPRCTPFFFEGAKVFKNATINPDGTVTGTLLTAGRQFGFANPFDRFMHKYKRNVFGTVVVPTPDPGEVTYVIVYNTIGGPFILNEAAYAIKAANIMAHDRTAYWEDLDPATVPTEWPPAPHPEPINLTYNVLDLVQLLQELVIIRSQDQTLNAIKSLDNHYEDPLDVAHVGVNPASVGLGKVPNKGSAVITDLAGNSTELHVTMEVLKEAFRQYDAGTLKF